MARAGHYDRADDIDLVAALGVRTVRYPILWERIERGEPGGRPWEWTDERMTHLRRVGVEPIVGLMHHGSGPMNTSLLDDDFPERLAAFAGRVAQRYPWVTHFTPVNEPLTTARFSALYGIWYPHARDDRLFLRALLNQIRATRLAMEAIRRVSPGACLVQTEDLGRTHSTAALAAQAKFENERRWLTFDLLAGRVTREHALWRYMLRSDIGADEVSRAVADGCPPDLIGVNHYVTSERWLDERLERYPAHTHGGNRRQRYADVEAVRARPDGVAGPAALLSEAWERYRIPIAVTEAHLGCTREQQMRWLHEVWEAAHAARDAGADVRAVTAWAILGAHDWSSLVTRERGEYEPGVFDTRAPSPRATALAVMSRALVADGRYDHPTLAEPGWWRHPDRLTYHTDAPAAPTLAPVRGRSAPARVRPLLITGGNGTLGSAFTRLSAVRGLSCIALSRVDLDVCDPRAVARALADTGAWAVVNAAGYVRVDDAERDQEACRRANVGGAVTLARACEARGLPFATFSSDLVFDGRKDTPYVESDRVAPLGVYGASKAEAECCVLEAAPHALVVRTAWFFGPWDEWNFITRSLRSIACDIPVDLPDDLVVSPTYVPHLVDATLDLLLDAERGVWHLANDGGASVADIVRRAARDAGLDASLVRGCPSSELGFAARRPARSRLASERGAVMPSIDRALGAFLAACRWDRETPGVLTPDGCAEPALAL